MGQKVVIVESPAKAKTINKYLGKDYSVLASYGHVRDLPAKDGSVRPDDDFAMTWELGERAGKPISAIAQAAKGAEVIYLASDPDREGEAIAWHVQDVLKAKPGLAKIPMQRVTFNEITKKAVTEAMAHPREIDDDLVDAYRARRALDYLVGFSLSPVLWRKLPGSRSAGRVQSVALRLICERESEIESFIARDFWTLEGVFLTAENGTIPATLTHLDGTKLDKFALTSAAEAEAVVARLRPLVWSVKAVERKQAKRHPWQPFTTSTLQQEASRRLGLGATRTMRLAQDLYEGVDIGGETVGLITYMRTDGVSLSEDAIAVARAVIAETYGDSFLPPAPRRYKTAAKNAQEAHEAIRPTDFRRRPSDVAAYLSPEALRLYTLVWQRAMASQMESATLDQVAVTIADPKDTGQFRANGSTVVFEGWLRVYADARTEDDDKAEGKAEAEDTRLPPVREGAGLTCRSVVADAHTTQPPPRYSEASLVKKLEELGIGRPSTYASIMQVLQDREYVRLDRRRFVPEDRGRIVTAFLENFFGPYVAYDFTADLEGKLDDISGGQRAWREVMRAFWTDFSGAVGATKDLKITDVINALDESLGPHFFPPREDGSDPRVCTVCGTGRIGLKLGKFGAFLGCSNYPTCRNTRPLAVGDGMGGAGGEARVEPRLLGTDSATGLPVTLRVGPYGAYVQLGPVEGGAVPAPAEVETKAEDLESEDVPKGKGGKAKKPKKAPAKVKPPKPPRSSLPKGVDADRVDLETALALLKLPREVGPHPESGEMILAGLGRFGTYLKIGARYKNLAEGDDVLTIGLNRAVALLAEPNTGRGGRGARAPGRPLGEHPDDNAPVTVQAGRYGPYVAWGKVYATLPKNLAPEDVTLEEAVPLLAAKASRPAKGKTFSRTRKPVGRGKAVKKG